jgi:hypothetical protein
LQGIPIQGHEVLKAREQLGVVENPVHEIHPDIVGNDQLLEEAFHDPKHRLAERLIVEAIGLVNLGHEIGGTDDGSGHQLREKGDEKPKVNDAADRLDLLAVQVHRVGNGLEGIEGNPDRQDQFVNRELRPEHRVGGRIEVVVIFYTRAKKGIEGLGKEETVLEINEDQQVDAHAQGGPKLPSELVFCPIYQEADQVIRNGAEDQQDHKYATGLVVEKQGDQEQEGIAEGTVG